MKDLSNYDFSGKRVRFKGKCMSKYALAYHIDYLNPSLCMTVLYELYSYERLRRKLYYLLSKIV